MSADIGFDSQVPSLSQGGGAIAGLGETFSAAPLHGYWQLHDSARLPKWTQRYRTPSNAQLQHIKGKWTLWYGVRGAIAAIIAFYRKRISGDFIQPIP